MDILSLLAPRIIVEVNFDVFIFQEGTDRYHLDTCLFVKEVEQGGISVIAIGDRSAKISDAFLVELFKPSALPSGKLNRFLLLRFFLEYGIHLSLAKNRPILRPTLVYCKIDQLEPGLIGYQKVLLEYAGLKAGARNIEFKD